MRNSLDNIKDLHVDRTTPRPDRSEIGDVLHESGASDGFTLEWVFDRYAVGKALLELKN